jgi:hypothetical protein
LSFARMTTTIIVVVSAKAAARVAKTHGLPGD